MVLRGILCIAFIYFLFYMAGFLFSKLTGQKCYKVEIVSGSILIISVFEIVCFPFLIIKNNFNILCNIFTAVIVLMIGCAIWFWCKNKEWEKLYMFHILKCPGGIFSALFLLIAIMQIIVTSYMHFNCYDDGYYIAISNMAKEQNVVELNDNVVYCGNYMLENFDWRPAINSWELLIAFFARLFVLPSAVLAHTFLPMLLIPLYYMAMNQVMKKLTDNDYDRFACLFIYSLLVMFYGTGYVMSSYMAVGTWVGKALLFHLVIPLLFSECIDIYEERQNYVTWIKIGMIAVVGISVTATGVYTVPVYLCSIAIPFVVYLLCHRRGKTVVALLKNAICSLTVFIGIGIYAVTSIICNRRGKSEEAQELDLKYIYFRVFEKDGILVILFVVALILIFLLGNSARIKLLFIGQTIMLSLMVLNPLTAEFVGNYITGNQVYWRMFLLLPVSFAIPTGGKYILNFICPREKRRRQIIFALISILIVILSLKSGRGMISVFSAHQNMYMIPDEILDVCESFDLSSGEMITILAEDPTNRFFRQYSSYFDVIIGRSSEVSRNEKEAKYKVVHRDIYEDEKIDKTTNKYLKELGVEYIISDKPFENSEWILCKKTANYLIYEVKGQKKHFII